MNRFVSVFVLTIFAAVTVPGHVWANGCGGGGGGDPAERAAKRQKLLWGRPASVEDAGQAMIDALMAMVGGSRRLYNGNPTNMFNIGDKGLKFSPYDGDYFVGWHEASELDPRIGMTEAGFVELLSDTLGGYGSSSSGAHLTVSLSPAVSVLTLSDLDIQLQGDVGDTSVGIYGDWADGKGHGSSIDGPDGSELAINRIPPMTVTLDTSQSGMQLEPMIEPMF